MGTSAILGLAFCGILIFSYFFCQISKRKGYKNGLIDGLTIAFADDKKIIGKHNLFKEDIFWKVTKVTEHEIKTADKVISLTCVNGINKGKKIFINYLSQAFNKDEDPLTTFDKARIVAGGIYELSIVYKSIPEESKIFQSSRLKIRPIDY